MNQVSKSSGGRLEKHLTKPSVPSFVLLSPLTVQTVRWRQRLTVDWMQLPRKKIETRQRQVAACGSGHRHVISCHRSLIKIYPNETWNSSGPFLNCSSRDGFSIKVSDFAVSWCGRETKRKELLAHDTPRKHTLEPVFGLAHWGRPGDHRVQMVDFEKLTVLIVSDYVHKRELQLEKILEIFRYTWENFMSRWWRELNRVTNGTSWSHHYNFILRQTAKCSIHLRWNKQ